MTSPPALTSEQVEELAKLLEAAQPGPWRVDYDADYKDAAPCICSAKPGYTIVSDDGVMEDADAAAIVELHNAAPALLEMARAYHRLTSALEFIAEHNVVIRYNGITAELDQENLVEAAMELGWKESP